MPTYLPILVYVCAVLRKKRSFFLSFLTFHLAPYYIYKYFCVHFEHLYNKFGFERKKVRKKDYLSS
jgi:hypothetical protein